MDFTADHTIQRVSLIEFEKLFFDESYNEEMCRALRLERRLISRDDDGTMLKRVVEVGPEREIPRALQKVLGQSRITYTEHIAYTWGTYRGVWHTVSSVLPDKVEAAGNFAFAGLGDGVRRTVSGAVRVKVFGVGKLIERFVVADTEQSYAKAAEFMQAQLDKRPV